ncbi:MULTISPECIES: site-specific integrase [Pseudomonas]|uniref:site-specific integrase n=1 Tax=Pseudomonas TaxID=286 RepID=UPI000C10DE5F|nr:DNA breaking-rejoining enzyme [Pseudomonadaceae bacterium]HCP54936.1 DNA breaking-rejoining enzyme [Pseudomonas sp.]
MNLWAEQVTADEELVSRDGYKFRLGDDRWRLSKDEAVPVCAVKQLLSPDLYLAFRLVLAFYATTTSAGFVRSCFYHCKTYLKATTGLQPFSVESLISYRSMLDKKNEWYLSNLRIVIKQWHAMGYPGIADEVIQVLCKWRLKAGEKGYAVQSMCPESGPLTDTEMQGVVEAVTTAFGEGRLALVDTALMLTFALTGRRPVQVTALKIKDLIKQTSKDGIDRFVINFPRAKQFYQGWRRSFSKFPINEDLWLVLQQQAAAVQREFTNMIGGKVPAKLVPELPLFPNLSVLDPNVGLEEQLRMDYLHMRTSKTGGLMCRVSEAINVTSERTGQPINLFPYRFRYTLGTNLAREGKREYVIAEALDHTDTQHVGVYVKNIPDIVKHINKAVALRLAPLAQAFQGVIVVSEKDAVRGNDQASRITNGSKGVGTCGSYGFCGAMAPIACYTCNKFQPWLGGPHETVLEELINERDRVLEQTNDLKIASVNDRLILAVSDVVNRCRAMMGEVEIV